MNHLSQKTTAPATTATTHILYQIHSCGYSTRVRNTLDQLDIRFEIRDILANDAYKDELYTAVRRSSGPCLRIEEPGNTLWLTEYQDIVFYLEGLRARS